MKSLWGDLPAGRVGDDCMHQIYYMLDTIRLAGSKISYRPVSCADGTRQFERDMSGY